MAAPDFSGPKGAAAPTTAPAPPTSAVGGVVFPGTAPAAVNPAEYPGQSPYVIVGSHAVPLPASAGRRAVGPAGGPGLGGKGLGRGAGSDAEANMVGAAAGASGGQGADAGVPDQVLVRGGHLIAPQPGMFLA